MEGDLKLQAEAYDDVSSLKQLFRTTSGILTEGIFQVDEDGMYMMAADPAKVGLVEFRIKPDYFDTYEVGQEFQAGVNLERFYEFINSATADDSILIKYGQGDINEYWNLELVSDNFTMKAGMPYLNLSEDDIPDTTDLEFENEFTLQIEPLKRYLSFVDGYGSVTLFSSEEGLKVECSGGDEASSYEKVVSELEAGEAIRYETQEDTVETMFSIDYLYAMFEGRRLGNLTDKVRVSMDTDYPLEITFEDERFSFRFVLAPRIEEE